MYNICRYIVSFILAISITFAVSAQEVATDSVKIAPVKSDSAKIAIWQGVNLEADLVPLITNLLNDNSTFRYEATARINLLNKYYPVVELGYEGQHTKMATGTDYMASGLFYRLGIDFNLVKQKSVKEANNKFLVGARLGFTNFGYDILQLKVRDEYTGQNFLQDFTDLRNSSLWFEVVAGIRIEVLKNVLMGWTVRMKNQIIQPEPGALQPLTIPGYGLSGGNVWSFNYMIGYQF